MLLNYNNLNEYDEVFISKVFTDTPVPEWIQQAVDMDSVTTKLPSNIHVGGTGFFFAHAPNLPDEIEHHMPDYHLYDEWIEKEISQIKLQKINEGNHNININKQLQYVAKTGRYIEETKTEAGTRVIPMTREVEECFRNIIDNRLKQRVEPMVDGVTGFLYFCESGQPALEYHWAKFFKGAVSKYNSIYRNELPSITPHVCRHTYCSNMAKSGMNPKTLQYLMGHSDISVTMNTYTHVNYEDAVAEVTKLGIV